MSNYRLRFNPSPPMTPEQIKQVMRDFDEEWAKFINRMAVM